MKKGLLGFLIFFALLAVIIFWKGGDIVDAVFYDMDAEMDLPDNLYENYELPKAGDSPEEPEDTAYYLADVKESLELHDAPDKNSDVIARLSPLTEMELISEASYPYQLVYVPNLDMEGYVHGDFIVKKGQPLKRARPWR